MATIKARLGLEVTTVETHGYEGGLDNVYTEEGWLTGYGLSLGYTEQAEGYVLGRTGDAIYVQGWMYEGALWESFQTYPSLNLARKAFVKLVKASLREKMSTLVGA